MTPLPPRILRDDDTGALVDQGAGAPNGSAHKLWGGRFAGGPSPILEAINRSPSQGGLVSNSLVYRYDVVRTPDGIPGD